MDVSAVAHGHWGQLDLDYAYPCYELGPGAAPLPYSGKGKKEAQESRGLLEVTSRTGTQLEHTIVPMLVSQSAEGTTETPYLAGYSS